MSRYRLKQTEYGNWVVQKIGLLWNRLVCSWDGDPALYRSKEEARRYILESDPAATFDE